MEKRTFLMLLDKYLAGRATPEEERLLEEYYRRLDNSSKMELSPDEETALRQLILRNVWEQIGADTQVVPLQPKRRFRLWYAAASVLLVIALGGYFIFHRTNPPQTQIAQNQIHDIAPGGNRATLTLADGRQILLAEARNGTIASQGKALVSKTADGRLGYTVSAAAPAGKGVAAAVYNTLTTKRGEQYQLTLPDGSKVFLNAASSIRYPVEFSAGNRSVELTGEGYFEVVHNAAQPFRVKVNGQLIEDVGTHFNINAYDDEPVLKTTLLEGAVRVTGNGQQVMLKPGQAAVGSANGKINVMEADPEEAVSWKEGYFRFDGDNLASIMRKVRRWYDAEIVFDDPKLQNQVFSGTLTVSRFKSVSQLLGKLELTGAMHYRIENNKIIISD